LHEKFESETTQVIIKVNNQQWMHKFGANRLGEHASGVGDEVWSHLWQLAVPGKIKIFGWRVLHGLIPCRGIFTNRHIENSSSCPACHGGCEDTKHLLFTCNRAKDIWLKLGVWQEIERILEVDRSG